MYNFLLLFLNEVPRYNAILFCLIEVYWSSTKLLFGLGKETSG